MRPLLPQLLRRATPHSGVWFAALVVALLMSGSPSVACPSLSLVCPAESAPPTQDGEDDTTDEVTRTPRLATVRLSSITTTDIPPGSVPLAFSRPPTAPLDTPVPFWHGLVPRLRC